MKLIPTLFAGALLATTSAAMAQPMDHPMNGSDRPHSGDMHMDHQGDTRMDNRVDHRDMRDHRDWNNRDGDMRDHHNMRDHRDWNRHGGDWRGHRGWNNHHRSCWNTWRHHHQVRVCGYR